MCHMGLYGNHLFLNIVWQYYIFKVGDISGALLSALCPTVISSVTSALFAIQLQGLISDVNEWRMAECVILPDSNMLNLSAMNTPCQRKRETEQSKNLYQLTIETRYVVVVQ